MINPFVTIFITIAATVAGQLLTKQGMSVAGNMPSGIAHILVFLVKTMIFNPYVFGGLVLAVMAAISWMATLSRTELSWAYPFMSLAFPLVLVLSGYIFQESISALRWAGLAIIMVGLIVVAKS